MHPPQIRRCELYRLYNCCVKAKYLQIIQIQNIVITGGKFQGDNPRPKEVVSLLLDDGEVEEKRM